MAPVARHKKKGGPEKKGRNEKSDPNQLRNKRRAPKPPALNVDRFAGSSEDEAENKPKGKRSAKRARKELAQQKLKEELEKKQVPTTAAASGEEKEKDAPSKPAKKESLPKIEKKTKPSPATGWQLKGGVVAKDIALGEGKPAKPGCKVSINYVGSFPEDGQVFDTNVDPNDPLQFRIGKRDVVEGLEIGLAGMKSGGKRIITIPPKMGYGREGAPPDIPGGATLQFEIHLLSFSG